MLLSQLCENIAEMLCYLRYNFFIDMLYIYLHILAMSSRKFAPSAITIFITVVIALI